MGKHFDYDLELAYGASKHSEYMAGVKAIGHSDFLNYCCAENVGCISLHGGEECTLNDVIIELKESPDHYRNMKNFSIIGIGVAIDNMTNTLYVTQRFK